MLSSFLYRYIIDFKIIIKNIIENITYNNSAGLLGKKMKANVTPPAGGCTLFVSNIMEVIRKIPRPAAKGVKLIKEKTYPIMAAKKYADITTLSLAILLLGNSDNITVEAPNDANKMAFPKVIFNKKDIIKMTNPPSAAGINVSFRSNGYFMLNCLE